MKESEFVIIGGGPGGHGGHGICLGPGAGKLIQELICDGKTSPPLDELNIARFYQT